MLRLKFSVRYGACGDHALCQIRTSSEHGHDVTTTQYLDKKDIDRSTQVILLRHFFFVFGNTSVIEKCEEFFVEPSPYTRWSEEWAESFIDLGEPRSELIIHQDMGNKFALPQPKWVYDVLFEIPGMRPYITYNVKILHSTDAAYSMPLKEVLEVIFHTIACLSYMKGFNSQEKVSSLIGIVLATALTEPAQFGLSVFDLTDDEPITYH